jgi:hypothetical protein
MATIPRIPIPEGPGGSITRPRATPGTTGQGLQQLGKEVLDFAQAKKNVEDTIEVNELLAEHSIRSRELQSEMLRTDLREDELGPEFEKRIKDLNTEIEGKARSQTVKDLLRSHLPSKTASKIGEIHAERDRRFTATALAGYERSVQLNTRAYAGAASDDERLQIRERHLAAMNVLGRMGVFSAEQLQKENSKFQRGIEIFDVQRAIQADPNAGLEALINPKKFLEKYPNVQMDDLDNIFEKGVQVEEQQRRLLQQRKKDAREAVISTIDEGVIRGKVTFEQLNTLRDRGLMDPDDYRRNATLIQKQDEEGGMDDPRTRGLLETRIRLNPYSVNTRELLGELERGGLSRKGVNDLLDLKHKWEKALKDDANTTDPRLRGPLYSAGKTKIDRIIGKGLGGIFGLLDEDTQRRYGAALDLYNDKVMKEPNRSHQDISDEIIKTFRGPPGKDFVPQKYKGQKEGTVDTKKLIEDYQKADPQTKKFLGALIDALQDQMQQNQGY